MQHEWLAELLGDIGHPRAPRAVPTLEGTVPIYESLIPQDSSASLY